MSSTQPRFASTPSDTSSDRPRHPVHVVLDNLRSAYNVGSIFRTADATAAAHLYLCGMSAHPPHRKLEKTALGAADAVPWTYHERTSDAIEGLRAEGIACVAVEIADDAVPLDEFDWPSPVALVFGNEVAGINQRTLARCDTVVRIPMHGIKNSLNVATAVGVVLYHVLGVWRRAS